MRRQNIDKVLISAILTAAGTMLLMSLIGIWMIASKQTNALSNTVIKNITETTKELSESEIEKFDGLCVNGNDVINFYKKHFYQFKSDESGPFTVTIINGTGSNSYINGIWLEEIRDMEDSRYVKPTSKYQGTVVRNENDIITEVIFEIQ